MRTVYLALIFLIIGFVLGWLGRSYDIDRALSEMNDPLARPELVNKEPVNDVIGKEVSDQAEFNSESMSNQARSTNQNPFIGETSSNDTTSSGEGSVLSTERKQQLKREDREPQTKVDLEQQFKAALQQREFERAIDIYRDLDLAGDERVAQFRAEIISKLKTYLSNNDGDAFTELANSFLSVYYNDIDVLLLLAEFNQQMNYFIEALNVYQMAKDYAYTSINTQKVREDFNQFISQVDSFYSGQQSWYMLRQLYERAELVNMLNADQRIRLAQIYSLTGDSYSSQSLLNDVIASGQSVKKAQKMLASVDGGSPQASPLSYDSTVALKRYGNQFAAELSLPDQYNRVNLLLDTGASLTTLSSTAFNQLSDHSQYTRLGSRMFHTANGVAMGAVYKFKEVRFGRFILRDVDIAVLDFAMSGDVQGLLGMNVLGQFKFHIDQQTSQLELSALP